MDSELVTIASTGATTVVALPATDGIEAGGARTTKIEMHAKASGHSQVNQSGRDQHITTR